MSFNGGSPAESDELAPLAEINVTPLVDVMLVMLIIFMVTAPMLSQGMKVELPQAQSAQPTEPQKPIVVTVSADGRIMVGADEFARADAAQAVRQLMGGEQRVVHVRGDRTASYGDVVTVLDELAVNGITKLSLIANQRREEPAGGKSSRQ